MAAVAEQLGALGSQVRARRGGGAAAAGGRRPRRSQAHERDLAGLAELEARLLAAENAPLRGRAVTVRRDALAARPPPRPGGRRSRRGSPCVPARSGSGRSRAGPRGCVGPRATERAAREAAAARRGRPGAAARWSPPPSRTAPRSPGARRPVRWPRPPQARAEAEQARTVREGELLRPAGPDPRAGRSSSRSSPTPCTVTRWPGPSSGCGSRRCRRGRWRSSGWSPRTLVAEYGPDVPVPPVPGPDGTLPDGRGAGALRPGRAAEAPRLRRSARWPCWAR